MTRDEAYKEWTNNPGHAVSWDDAMAMAFTAGWQAKEESLKQSSSEMMKEIGSAAVDRFNAIPTYKLAAADIYAAYPRKVGRDDAIRAIEKRLKFGTVASVLLDQTRQYAAATANWPAEDKKYIPHPATWYNRGSFADDPQEWVKGAAAMPSQFSRSY